MPEGTSASLAETRAIGAGWAAGRPGDFGRAAAPGRFGDFRPGRVRAFRRSTFSTRFHPFDALRGGAGQVRRRVSR